MRVKRSCFAFPVSQWLRQAIANRIQLRGQPRLQTFRQSCPCSLLLPLNEDIRREVNRRAGDRSSRSFLLDKAAKRDSFVKRKRDLIEYIRNIRNLLVHAEHKSRDKDHAFHISESFLKEVEILLRDFKNPPTANSVGVSREQIMTARLTDQLGVLADEMKQKCFSHVPILDENDVVIGVFNRAAVFDYLRTESKSIVERQTQISDILHCCRLDADHTETFMFVNSRKKRDDLVKIFQTIESRTTRVGAVFVTAYGNNSKPLKRLITPWDVLHSFRSNEN